MPENNLINVGGRLHSIATGNNLVGANEVFDDDKNKKQSVINTETDTRVTTVETDLNSSSSGLKARVHTLEEQVAFDGEFEVANNPEDIISGSGKITSANAVSGAVDAINARTGFFECNTRGDIADKVVDAPGFVLREGGSIKIQMNYRNTANNVTLNINSTGAKPLIYNGYTAWSYNTWNAKDTIEVYYVGDAHGDFYTGNSLGYNSDIFILDVSRDNVEGATNKTYNSLSQALNDIAIIKRKSGMTIRYISSITNKYEQYRYLLKYSNTTAGNNDFVNVDNWTKGEGDGVFDVSEKNAVNGAPAKYASLSEVLNDTAIPAYKRKGGMSIKFIQTTPAKYTVVKTEGATEQPTGTEVQSDPGIISGTYTAGELSAFSTLPATLNSSLTYYLAVTETVDEQEVTTYTSWVITCVQSSDNIYVQYRLMSDTFNTTVANWQGVDAEPITGSRNLVKSGGVAPIMTIMDDVLITKGKAYNTNTGVYVDSQTMFCSPMLKLLDINPNYLTEGIKFISGDLTTPTSTFACITWFDATKTKISDTGITPFRKPSPITASVIPSNAVYAIFNSNKNVFGANTPVVFEGYGLAAQRAINTSFDTAIRNNASNISNINTELGTLNRKVTDNTTAISNVSQVIVTHEIRVGSFSDNGKIRNINNDRYYFIPVQPSSKVLITVGSHGTHICVCKSDNGAVVGQTLDMSTVSGFTQRINVPASTTTEYIMPSDAAYIAVVKVFNNEDWNVSSIKVDDFEVLKTLKGNVEDVAKQLGGYTLWKGTQADYDAIATKDSNTIYLIVES